MSRAVNYSAIYLILLVVALLNASFFIVRLNLNCPSPTDPESFQFPPVAKQRIAENGSVPFGSLPDARSWLTSHPGCGQDCRQVADMQRWIDCRAIMEGDGEATSLARRYLLFHPRLAAPERVRRPGDCRAYTANPFYRKAAGTGDGADFPVAYSIVVHRNPDQLERLIRMIYWPQNVYCIHVDAKASSALGRLVSKLVECFPNVIAAEREVVVYGGFSRLKADLNCMSALLRDWPSWRYVINLTGEEYPLRTNRELVRILRLYNGSNDVEGLPASATGRFRGRYDRKWRVGHGRVMTRDVRATNPPPPANISLVKGSAFGAFSRRFVEFALSDRRAAELLDWLRNVWSPDEFFWATLNARLYNPDLAAPGGYDGAPDRKPWLAKYVAWPPRDRCKGRRVRNICIFSAADLPALIGRPELFANKFYLDDDYVPLHCLEEWIINKTVYPLPFDDTFYKQLPFVSSDTR